MLFRSYEIRAFGKICKAYQILWKQPYIFISNNKYDKTLLIAFQNLKQFICEQTFHVNIPFTNTIKNFLVFLYIVLS